MEDFCDLGIYTYKRTCEKCKKVITIIQNGDELSEISLKHVLEHAHLRQRYDSYHRYLRVNDYHERIDVDLLDNKACQSQS